MSLKQKSLSQEASEVIKQGRINHIAVIMDGNRRWARQHNFLKSVGHSTGRKTFKTIVEHSAHLGLGFLTTYAFSTENWGRDRDEVNFLMDLLVESINTEIKELCENNIRLKFIGRKDRFTQRILSLLTETELETTNNTGLYLQIALDYGSRYEITDAVKRIVEKAREGEISVDDVNENLIQSYLYTSEVPDPDLIIRTGGEYRLSNYLLWQAAYSELYVTPTFWPDFTVDEFDQSILNFSKRQRRWGKD